MTEQSTFDFGEHGISKPDENGLYQGFFCNPDEAGVTEAEAIRQWLCGVTEGLHPSNPNWQYIERLVDLAEGRDD